MSDEYKTYDDDSCMNVYAPATELGDVIDYPSNGLKRIDLHPGKVNVVYFMCKFEKGAYIVNEEMSEMTEALGDAVQVLALSTDPDRGTVEKFLAKTRKGEVTDLNTGKPYRLTMEVGWDEQKRTFGMYRALCGGKLTTYHAFVINKEGKIVWHQQFAQTCPVSKTNFVDQVKKAIAGEPLELNGDRPKKAAEDIEEEDAECDDMALF